HVVDRLCRSVREIDDHSLGFHSTDHLFAFVSQSALLNSVRRAADVVVEEMSRRHHPEACLKQHVDVVEVAVKRVGAFDAEKSRGDVWVSNATVKVARKVI